MKRFLAAVLVTTLLGGQVARAQTSELRVGVLLALSGPAAYLGDPVQKALKLLLDNYNAHGGIAGRKLTLITYDTEANTGKAVQLFRRLVESDKVPVVIGPSTTGESIALISVANELHTPMISFGAGKDIISPATQYVFKVPPTDETEIKALVKDFAHRGWNKVAVLYAAGPYGQSGITLLHALAPAAGLTLVAEEQFQPLDTDMTPQIVRARNSNADAMLTWATDPAETLIVKQAAALGYDKPIVNSPGAADPNFIRNGGVAAEGTYVQSSRLLVAADLPADDPQKPALVWLVNAYRKQLNAGPPQNVGHAYDALMLIQRAVEGIPGPLSGEAIAKALETVSECGANGCFHMSATDHNGLPPESMVLLQIHQGRWVLAP